jgi:hypothetical protein
MSLTTGKQILISDLVRVFTDVAEFKTAIDKATQQADAIHSFFKSGIPKTNITFPGVVMGPMTGFGFGGIDTTSSSGLNKSDFKNELVSVWDHRGQAQSVQYFATKQAEAIFNYYSKAKLYTSDLTAGPAGPISGSGGIGSKSPGPGFDSAKSALIKSLTDLFNDTATLKDRVWFADRFSTAVETFALSAQVRVSGIMTGSSTGSGIAGHIF